jgi:hypothetical protein
MKALGVLVAVIVAAMLPLWGGSGDTVFAQTISRDGILHIVHGDPPPGTSARGVTRYFLSDSQGVHTELLITEASLRVAGGVLALNRQLVSVTGSPQGGPLPSIQVQTIQPQLQ